MGEHTPGPWRVKDRNDSPQFGVRQIVDASGRHIGDVTRDEAALIAAAPDLLAALEEIAAWGQPNKVNPIRTIARAAIAKAKGDA